MVLTKYLADENATLQVGARLAQAIPAGGFIYLHGNLGAGKTTFVRGFLRGLGYEGKVKSPTYTLIEPYEIADRLIYHCDFYRIKNIEELEELGVKEYFLPDAICLVEWPDKGETVLPPPDLVVALSSQNTGREIVLTAHSARGEMVLTCADIG